jgi:outer membrane cobalamin receptor
MFDLKKIITLFTLLLIFSSSGCSATKATTNEKVKVETPSNANISLLDQLRRSPGLIIRGSGQNAQIFLRGISSINSPKEVLFIINGTQVGSFSRGASSLSPQEISFKKSF